jgi:hypothetical protein
MFFVRKTDVADTQWLATRVLAGLLRQLSSHRLTDACKLCQG